jgi:hypothetical protein
MGDEQINFTPDITLTRAMGEPTLFGSVFGKPSFWPWFVVSKLIDGIPLTEQREIDLFQECTGRTYNRQARRVTRLAILAGRRAGKDRFLSAVAVWRAALCTDWRKYQSAGEGAVCLLLGADKKQASILRRYCQGLLQEPLLAREVVRTTGELTEFKNGSSLEIATNDVRLVRGRSAIAILGSESCYWKTSAEASSSDAEVVGAAEPSMSMCPDTGLLLLGSSVYRKRGYMYERYKKLFGNNEADDICWFAPTPLMNPLLRQSIVEKALAEDGRKASAEYLNVWREDLSDFIPLDALEGATDFGVYERPPVPGQTYRAHADSAGGTGQDSYGFCISHREFGVEKIAKVDVLREYRPRFVPSAVIAELAVLCKKYGISELEGDRFAGGFHIDEWQRHGIRFKPCERTTSENYLQVLPLLLSGRVRLIDSAILRNQFAGLERKMTAAGHESVSHMQVASAHDDLATAAAGALVACGTGYTYDSQYRAWDENYVEPDARPATPSPQPQQSVRLDEWWKLKPPATTTDFGYRDNLRAMYSALDTYTK